MTLSERLGARGRRVVLRAVTVGAAAAALVGLGRRGWIPGSYRLRVWVNEQRHAMRIEGFAREKGEVPAGAVYAADHHALPRREMLPLQPFSVRYAARRSAVRASR